MKTYIRILLFACVIQCECMYALKITGDTTISIHSATMSMALQSIAEGCSLTLQTTTGKYLDTINLAQVNLNTINNILTNEKLAALTGKTLYEYLPSFNNLTLKPQIIAQTSTDGTTYTTTDLHSILQPKDEQNLSTYIKNAAIDEKTSAIVMNLSMHQQENSLLGTYEINNDSIPISFICGKDNVIPLEIIDKRSVNNALEFCGTNSFYNGDTRIETTNNTAVKHKANSMFGGKTTYKNAIVSSEANNTIGGDITLDASSLQNDGIIFLTNNVTIDCSNSTENAGRNILLGQISGEDTPDNIIYKLTINSSTNKKIHIDKRIDKCFFQIDSIFEISDYVAIANVRNIQRPSVKTLIDSLSLQTSDIVYAIISNLIYAQKNTNDFLEPTSNVKFVQKTTPDDANEHTKLVDILTHDGSSKYFLLHKNGINANQDMQTSYVTGNTYVFEPNLANINIGFIGDTNKSNNYTAHMKLPGTQDVEIFGNNANNNSTYYISSAKARNISFHATELKNTTLEIEGEIAFNVI